MKTTYDDAVDRAESHGLITLDDNEALGCLDCGAVDPDAFAIGPCPTCGSARAKIVQSRL